MNIIQKKCTANMTVKKNRKIEYIVIHYTAGVSSSGKSDENVAAWFNRSTTKASSDFIVDDDSVTQFNPDIHNQYTWHCGGKKYATKGGSLYKVCTNANSIGIEVCSNSKNKKVMNANDPNWFFTDETLGNLVELTKRLMQEYDIPVENVIRHYDVTGKLCPGIVGWNADSGDESAWNDFKNRLSIESRIYELEQEVEMWKNKYNKIKEKIQEILCY